MHMESFKVNSCYSWMVRFRVIIIFLYNLVEMMPAINTSGMSANDILSFSLTGNNLALFQTKFALSVANEPIQAQLPSIKFILPKLTILKAVFNMQSGTAMLGTATCMFRGVAFG